MEPEQPTRRPWRLIASIVGGVATAASLVIGFVAIVPILTQSASGVDKLDLAVSPYRDDEVLLYAVPVDAAPHLPTGEGSDACSAEQLAWLDTHATRLPGYVFVTITNRATSGNVIGVSDIVGVGENSPTPAGSVAIECVQVSANRIAPVVVDASSGRAAYYDRSRMDDAGASPDTPLIYNLQPGESGQFVLRVTSTFAFAGDVQFTVTSGADRATRTLDLGGTVELPGSSPLPVAAVLAGDPFWACTTTASVESCLP